MALQNAPPTFQKPSNYHQHDSPARLLRQIRQEFEEAIGLYGYLFGFWDGGQAVVL
jgi:hypothetical protein